MLANVKNILVGLTYEPAEDEVSSALAYGLSLAREANARLTVQASSLKIAVNHSVIGSFAARLVATETKRLKALAMHAAREAHGAADLAGVICRTETPHLDYPSLVAKFIAQARVHDVTILDAEDHAISVDRGFIESALFDSGRPVIVVPKGTDTFKTNRVAIAWDGSVKAARAVSDAMPFLRAADVVQILVVSGEKDLSNSVPAADIAVALDAHGIEVSVCPLAAVQGNVAAALRRHTLSAAIDLLVMGAYAHSWVRQVVLGGVTQSMLKSTPVPLLMAS